MRRATGDELDARTGFFACILVERVVQPAAVSLSDDELVSARLDIGVAHHFQFDLRLGGVLIPVTIGGAIALPGGIAAGGGAGVVVLGRLVRCLGRGTLLGCDFTGDQVDDLAVYRDTRDGLRDTFSYLEIWP